MTPGQRLTLTVEKPAAGGRMIARHDGAIVLVSAAIPGEVVEAAVEKFQRGTIWARTMRVVEASPDRVEAGRDWSCGGNVFAHVAYPRQLTLKAEIIRDALTRIGRIAPPETVPIAGSPTDGYRMRARLHVDRGAIGFYKEGTHILCDPALTRQLLPATTTALLDLEAALEELPKLQVLDVEVAENCAADQRAIHLVLEPNANGRQLASLPQIAGVSGISYGYDLAPRAETVWGSPEVTDTIRVTDRASAFDLTLTRHARSFFQGNRFLLADLVSAAVAAVPAGRVLDLYAGVGLFSTALAARGDCDVIAVEGDRAAADDLAANAARAAGKVSVRHQAVETYLVVEPPTGIETLIVDPPRTGMSKEAVAGVIALGARRIVYISCDVATFARDTRTLIDAGYTLSELRGFDLFPNTAHVESLAVFEHA